MTTRCQWVWPIDRAQTLAKWLVAPSTSHAPTETSQNGRVSLSRCGRPFRSHAQRLST